MSNRIFLSLLLILVTCTAAAALTIHQPVKTKDTLYATAQYEVPQGWEEKFSINQGDSLAVLSRDLHEITVRFSGGEKSRYKTADDFLAGFESRSHGGKPAEKIGAVDVSGMSVMMYRREVVVSLPPPDTSGPATFTDEEFCVVSAGKMFFILRYSYGDSMPDFTYNGRAVWRKFLKNFRTTYKKIDTERAVE